MGYTILCFVVTNTIKQMLMRFELNAKQPECTKGAVKPSTISPWLCAYNAMWASTQKFAYPHISNGELSKKTRALWSCEFCIGFQAQTHKPTHTNPLKCIVLLSFVAYSVEIRIVTAFVYL